MNKRKSARMMLVALSFIVIISLASFSYYGSQSANRSASGGELSFTVRTVPAGGNFAPRHVLAIWIQNSSQFVKTRKAMASQRKQYLYTWAAISNYNVVDAITGPTLTSHQTHTVTWDCTDLGGNIVPDGEYTVYVEFTDQHAQGPLYSINFTKGADPQFFTPPDQTYFKDIVLSFTPFISDFSANDTVLCPGDTVTFSDESVNASAWEWDFGEGASPATASTQGPHHVVYSTTGSKTVSLTINGSLTETKNNYVFIDEAPIADFSYSSSELAVDFTNTSINATDYLWDFGDGNTSILENPMHTYASAGTYNVSLAASHTNCDDETVMQITVPMVGVEEVASEKSIQVFPNPNNGRFFLRIDNPQEVKTIRLINVSGQVVNHVTQGEINNTLISIDLGEAEDGIYLLEIVMERETISRKILVR